MSKSFLFKLLVIVTLSVAVGINISGRDKGEKPASLETDLHSIMPEADSFNKKEEPFLYYEGYQNKRLVGYCLYTDDIAHGVKGVGGPIEMLVSLGEEGNILNLKVLSHNEVPEYAGGIVKESFLGQFKGKDATDAFIIGRDVDAITQATISSGAIATTLKICLEEIEALLEGREMKQKAHPPLTLDRDFYITVAVITFLLLAFYLKRQALRYIGLAMSLIYFGFLNADFISMTSLGNIFLLNLPDWRTNATWYVFIFSGIGLTVLLGGFFCSYMCPFGALQIFFNKVFKFNVEISVSLQASLRKVRYVLLWILSVFVISFNNPNIANYEPFATVFLQKGSVVAWAILGIILALSLFHHRPFCNYFCATGAFLDSLSNLGRKIFRGRKT